MLAFLTFIRLVASDYYDSDVTLKLAVTSF